MPAFVAAVLVCAALGDRGCRGVWAGAESAGDPIAVRKIDKASIRGKIEDSRKYLLRVMDKEKHGFYKKYDVLKDSSGGRLRTIYSASSLLTLMKIQDLDPDPETAAAIPAIADFILSMQSREPEHEGAFHYSASPVTGEKDNRFMVGTASKTVFTLLELFRRAGDPRYLESAEAAGDWLITMVNPDGSVRPALGPKNGTWVYDDRESFLYTGQVLSALSRLYAAAKDRRYFDAAGKIAGYLADKARTQGYYAGDDYRPKNSISTSWIVMSLLDFHKATGDGRYEAVIFRSLDEILKRQMNDPSDIANYGRWSDSAATSGNGWINEVLVEVYRYFKTRDCAQCEEVKRAIIKAVRWLVQNTYSLENTFSIKEPEKAVGGLVRNSREKSVRTDAVCHAANGYIGILPELPDGWTFTAAAKPWLD